ncbi:MAG: DUF5702 domain-containing protein [Lachnospiraceae bacterium]|nr:DUF5702 domain-containing protein [Lachnospiraceae bacterium]
MDKNRLKGSITVFISLTLSFLMMMVICFTMLAVGNAEKMRFEIASDVSFNSVLGEFSRYLYDRFDLLYIDASYLSSSPGIGNVEHRLMRYMKANTEEILDKSHSPWGKINMESCRIESYEAATACDGLNLANQAIIYVRDSPHTGEIKEEVEEAATWAPEAGALELSDPMRVFGSYMEALLGKELPMKKNEKGIMVPVPLSNPADCVYALAGSDVLYLAGEGGKTTGVLSIDLSDLISHRGAENTSGTKPDYGYSEEEYITYLADKFGCHLNERDEGVLKYGLEYIAIGEDSDFENYRKTVEKIFKWRFADNLELAFNDGGLRGAAESVALELEVCSLDPSFIDPVADTIVAACAFLETVSDVSAILSGGRVPLRKSSHGMSVESILSGGIYKNGSDEGLCYRQYVEIMIINLSLEEKIMRAMDLMESETRAATGNGNFRMDWCIEEIKANITGHGSGTEEYVTERKYGYF